MSERPWAEQQMLSMRSSLTAPPGVPVGRLGPLMPMSRSPFAWITEGFGLGEMGSSSLSIITRICRESSSIRLAIFGGIRGDARKYERFR